MSELSDLTKEDLAKLIEEREAEVDKAFATEFDELCRKFKRVIVPYPVLVPDQDGAMRVAASAKIARVDQTNQRGEG